MRDCILLGLRRAGGKKTQTSNCQPSLSIIGEQKIWSRRESNTDLPRSGEGQPLWRPPKELPRYLLVEALQETAVKPWKTRAVDALTITPQDPIDGSTTVWNCRYSLGILFCDLNGIWLACFPIQFRQIDSSDLYARYHLLNQDRISLCLTLTGSSRNMPKLH